MRKPERSGRSAAARRREHAADDDGELRLLQEFTRCGSVAALAGAIAARLGRADPPERLVADAGLDARAGRC